jgi:hypothetical protein
LLIKTLTVDETINVESINGKAVADLVYKSNRRNQRMKEIIANKVVINEMLFVNGKVDGIEMAEDNVFLNLQQQVLRPLKLQSFTANTVAGVAQLNAMPFNDFVTMLRRKVDKKIPNMIHQLTVDTMTIGRFLNQRNFTAMSINALKTSGNQILSGSTNIGRLKANRLIFQKVPRDQTISNVPLSVLININDTSKKIDIAQDIRFVEDLHVEDLVVKERINNINVKNGEILVLRKRGRSRQIVTGEKFFDFVNLLSPIVLQGKIESKTLERMNPIVTVNENLVLQGNYKITGPVTIKRIINATEDIASINEALTLRNLLENGLNLFTTKKTSNKLVFKGVVEVKKNLQAVSLNEKPVANFVKTNFQDQQTIHGTITFSKSLLVYGGTVQADIINDVDVNKLNKTILKRFSPVTQFIDGNVELVELQVPQLVSSNVKVNGKSLDLVLNTNMEQELNQMTVHSVNVKSLKVTNMQQKEGGKIFGTDLNFLIDDTVTKKSLADDSFIAEKEFTNLEVEHLMFSDENEWKSIITNFENAIAQDLNITEDLTFDSEMRIGNLFVTGTINGVSYDDMLNNWLQIEGAQEFTAPQRFASMEIENNLILNNGSINGIDIAKMVRESIWIDEPLYVENVVIEGEAAVWGKVMSPMVNGIDLNGKLILNNTNEPQTIKKIVLDGDTFVEYLNFTNINGIDCEKFTSAFAGDNNDTVNLMIHGGAVFNYQPKIVNLNHENLQELYESIWVADRDVILTGDDIQFLAGVTSDGDIYTDVSCVAVVTNDQLKTFFQSFNRRSTRRISSSTVKTT